MNGKIYKITISAANPIVTDFFTFSNGMNNIEKKLLHKVDLSQLSVATISGNTLKISVFPNPSNNIISFNKEIEYFNVVHISGKRVVSFDTNMETFDISKFNNGMSLIKGKSLDNNYFI